MIRCDDITRIKKKPAKNMIYMLNLQYGDGDWYLYVFTSKKRLIKFREKLRRNAKGTYARVRRSRIKLISANELREMRADGVGIDEEV